MSSEDINESPDGKNLAGNSGDENSTERDLFMRAIEIADPAQRTAFLESACGGHTALLRCVQDLLHKHDSDTNLIIDRPLFPETVQSDSAPEIRAAGVMIGEYRLVKKLGEGGMGEVWLAHQRSPMERDVAVKLVRSGRETRGVLQRFDAERQALAVMDHPNIARVIDAGETASGLPYFVMELVEGLPLNEYCDQNRLTVRQRLEIFIQVAQAISHAHQKAILHRDLKPSNVLVAEVDGRPVPKVIDFGLAKALAGSLTSDPMATRAGDVVGTLEYMAPEQAGFQGQDVDTRADVYALGVLLYELLTGLRPFDAEQLEKAALDEALRIVKEDNPTLPSLRLSSSGDAASMAQLRQTDSSRLRSLLRNELDWIVMKAIEKDRDRRYQSAGEFADDVNRYLTGEPVEAHPPSHVYRMRKFISKNRGLATSLAAVTIALLMGVAGTSYGLWKANTAAEVALEEKAAAETSRNEAIASAAEENRQKQFAVAITDFLKEDILELTSAEGRIADARATGNEDKLGLDATLGDLLDRASEKLVNREDLDPKVVAELCWTIGRSYRRNGDPEKAIPLLQQAINDFRGADGDESKYRTVRNSLTVAYLDSLRLEEAKELIDEAVGQTIDRAEDNLDVAQGYLNLAVFHNHNGEPQNAIEACRRSVELARQWETPTEILMAAIDQLGTDLCFAGKFVEGLPLLEESILLRKEFLSENHPATLESKLNYAVALRRSGDTKTAISIYEELLPASRETIGDDKRLTLSILSSLATAYSMDGRNEEAIVAGTEAIEIAEAAFGERDRSLTGSLILVAILNARDKNFDKAIPFMERAFAISVESYTERHQETLSCMDRLANTLSFAGRAAEAAELFEKALALRIEILGESHPATLKTFYRLGNVLQKTGSYDRSAELMKRRYDLTTTENGAEHRSSLQGRSDYLAATGINLLAKGDPEEAEAKLLEAVQIREKMTPGLFVGYRYQSLLGEAQMKQEKYSDAKASMESAAEGLRAQYSRLPDGAFLLGNALDRLIQLAEAMGDEPALKKWQTEKNSLAK